MSASEMLSQIVIAVLCFLVVATRARVLDDDYLDYWNQYKGVPWFYDDLPAEDVPASLHELEHWPAKDTRAMIGQVGGLAVNSQGHPVVFHRADRRWGSTSFVSNRLNSALGPIQSDVILTLDKDTGDVISHIGAGQFYMPHGLTIDNDDNMWVTDVGSHQVVKIPKDSTTGEGRTWGTKMEPGNDDAHFCKPTDVAVASTGEFFVADGYCNGRIMMFGADGELKTQWGKQSHGFSVPAQDEFYIPHSLALDESRDLLCVADRENGRIQCFDAGLNGTTAGTFRDSLQPGRGTIYAIEYDPNADVLYAVNGPGMGGIIEGFTLDMQGDILETWGPEYQPFDKPHDVTVSRDGKDVYVGDIGRKTEVFKLDRPMPMEAEEMPSSKLQKGLSA